MSIIDEWGNPGPGKSWGGGQGGKAIGSPLTRIRKGLSAYHFKPIILPEISCISGQVDYETKKVDLGNCEDGEADVASDVDQTDIHNF